jgi:hypothetical protein
MHCRFCRIAAGLGDLLALARVSYSAALRGHTPASLREIALELERSHVHAVTTWCPACLQLGIEVFPLLAQGAPADAAVAEHVLALHEASVLHRLLLAADD